MVGEASEVEVFAALHRAGYVVLIAPFTDNARYDCVIDDGERLLRVQIKTARLTPDGCVIFDASSINWNTNQHRHYHGQADLFAAYCEATRATYLVPVNDCGRRTVRLRLIPTRNNQQSGVRWARDFELKSLK